MSEVVRTYESESRQLAAGRAVTNQQQLSTDIRRLLDAVWPLLREQGVPVGHNVVVYHPGSDGTFEIEAGVETPAGFTPNDTVRTTSTPAGEVATAAHYGDYSQLKLAYEALDQWCSENGRQSAGVSWEVYGDWDEDPSKVRTDVYYLLAK